MATKLPQHLIKYKDFFPIKEDIEKDIEVRDSFLPIKHHHLIELYKRMEANFWTDEDIDKDAEKDCSDRENVSKEERRAFDYIQSFFAVSDFVVAETVGDVILQRIKSTDVRICYQYIVMMENIHMMTYSKVIDKAVTNTKEKIKLLKSATEIPSIKRKLDWIKKWVGKSNDIHKLDDETIIGIMELVTSNENMLKALHPGEDIEKYKSDYIKNIENKLEQNIPQLDSLIVTTAIMEGVFFQGSFALIYWFAKNGKFPGASKANEKISEDEGQHVENGATVHNTLIKYKDPEILVHEKVREAVDIESDFIRDAIPNGMRGMNSELMIRYIKFSADWVLSMFGYNKIYNIKVEDTFDFMVKQSITDRFSDFFKTREVTYKRHGENETHMDKQIVFDESSSED